MNNETVFSACRTLPFLSFLLVAATLVGCSSASKQSPKAPVEDRTSTASQPATTVSSPSSPPSSSTTGAAVHQVVSGDTLYSIARQYGVTVPAIVAANGLADANQISVGQQLTIPGVRTTTASSTGVVTKGISTAPPKETAIDQPASTVSGNWIWPVVGGKVVGRFGEKGNTGVANMGIDIAAPQGAAVLAAESGKVIFSGNNIRGYGDLIVLRHGNDYLTAYGYNSKLLVKEGDTVKKGDKIAEVGSTGTDSPKLHFEIRNSKSKPEDPLRYLPKQ